MPQTKKRRRNNKDKLNGREDVTEGTIGEVDKKKKRKSKDTDTVP